MKTKEQYVDGFVLIIPKKNIQAYAKLATTAGKIWIEHGAIEYRECVADDLKTMMGVSFTALTKAKKSELVIFSWITYKNLKHRNAVNAKVMEDPRIKKMDPKKMPFDCNKMSYGGFKILVSKQSS